MSKAIFAKQYRLLSMPHAQCRVYIKRFDDGSVSVELISYETSVCLINYNPVNGAALYCSGTYSVTTARHINRFTSEFCEYNRYHECKAALRNPDNLLASGWYSVCHIDHERFLKMCDRYEEDARGYYGRY